MFQIGTNMKPDKISLDCFLYKTLFVSYVTDFQNLDIVQFSDTFLKISKPDRFWVSEIRTSVNKTCLKTGCSGVWFLAQG